MKKERGNMYYESNTSTSYVFAQLEKAAANDIPYQDMDILEWINEDFPKRLLRFLEEKLDIDLCRNDEYQTECDKFKLWKKALKSLAKEKNVQISKNILSRWIPTGANIYHDPARGGEQTRPHIYCLAYILDLDIDEISDFFHKVFRMRPFDLKNKQEIIWWYYLNNANQNWYSDGVTLYNYLQELHSKQIEDQPFNSEIASSDKLHNLYTESISEALSDINSDEQLASLILSNWDTLTEEYQMLTAKKDLRILAEQAQYWADCECGIYPEKNITRKDIYKNYGNKSDGEYADITANHLLSTITGINKRLNASNTNKLLIFPSYYDLTNALNGYKASANTLRKLLIILAFYVYVASCSLDVERKYSKEQCVSQINYTLNRAGFYPLYVYDEYDLIFLYAIETGTSNPVVRLRSVIEEICF